MIREWIAHVIILNSKDIRSFIDPSSVNLKMIIKFRLPQADVHVEAVNSHHASIEQPNLLS